jgi:hypothetical protein
MTDKTYNILISLLFSASLVIPPTIAANLIAYHHNIAAMWVLSLWLVYIGALFFYKNA